jgi:HK97 family phage prohead protease
MTIDRAALLALDGTSSRRNVPAMFEMRAASDSADDTTRVFRGHACVTGIGYDVYGGAPYGWTEIVQRGAFAKTLSEKPDVVFLVNHEGLSLASTWAGTLSLSEDETGLVCEATFNAARSDANDFILAVEDGAMREMSFGFRVIRQVWEDDEGNEADSMTGTVRRIMEVSLNKGDVSGVNFGANDATFGSIDRALAELRAGGAQLTDSDRALLRALVDVNEVREDIDPPATGPSILALRATAAPSTRSAA